MPLTYLGDDPEHFQKLMGKGGVIGSKPRPERPAAKPPTAKGIQTKADSEEG